MHTLERKDKDLVLKFSTEELSPTQVRLIKSLHALMANVVASEEEADYFEASADLLKKAAELIKHSNFNVQNKNISYGDQAVEFAVDTLNEAINEQKLQNIDN